MVQMDATFTHQWQQFGIDVYMLHKWCTDDLIHEHKWQ